jgi:hypothetical protein
MAVPNYDISAEFLEHESFRSTHSHHRTQVEAQFALNNTDEYHLAFGMERLYASVDDRNEASSVETGIRTHWHNLSDRFGKINGQRGEIGRVDDMSGTKLSC